jgi:bla regulator protein BlaR1
MLDLLLWSAVRATLLAAVVALVLGAMRVRQAAVRHAAWTGVVATMLALPVLLAWAPRISLPVLRAEDWQQAQLTRIAMVDAAPAPPAEPFRDTPPPEGWRWELIGAGVYGAGLTLLLLRLAIGAGRVRRMLRESSKENGRMTHPGSAAPVAVGWLRPVVVLPAGWSDWPRTSLSAILAHEQEHVRRRDPLIQCLALLNRAVFWFHPLAWWLEREVSRLSEEACDAAVLARGHRPREYAECLLGVARAVADAGARVHLLGASAVGRGLPSRIRRIMMTAEQRPVSRRRLACIAIACGVAATASTIGSLAHAQLAAPAFDVATIKPNKSGEQGGTSKFEGSSYIGVNVPLMRVIRLAYSPIQEFTGGPGWIESERYDIVAKAEGTPTRPQLQLMLRSLLADRFQVVVHKETREKPAFALVLARPDGKLGPTLRKSEVDCSPANRDKAPKAACGFRAGPGLITSRSATMEMLASELIMTGRLVVDRTGLTGTYELDLRWTPDEFETGAALVTALREQLGLKLEAIRAPVEVIVVDKAERPSAN